MAKKRDEEGEGTNCGKRMDVGRELRQTLKMVSLYARIDEIRDHTIHMVNWSENAILAHSMKRLPKATPL